MTFLLTFVAFVSLLFSHYGLLNREDTKAKNQWEFYNMTFRTGKRLLAGVVASLLAGLSYLALGWPGIPGW